MSIIGRKIYEFQFKNNSWYNYGFVKSEEAVKKIQMLNKVKGISNNIQDKLDDVDKINYIGNIEDFSFSANYDVNLSSISDESHNHSAINFRGFSVFLKVKKGKNFFIIKAEDVSQFKYNNIKIVGFEVRDIISKNNIKYLPLNEDRIYPAKFNYLMDDNYTFQNTFNIIYNCHIKYDNETFKERFLEDVDFDNKNFNRIRYGYRILKNYEFGESFVPVVKEKIKKYLVQEFERLNKQQEIIFNKLEKI